MRDAIYTMTPCDVLKRARRFTIGPVGFAAMRSKEETAFRSILTGSTPSDEFKSLLSGATLSGRLYALLGLKLLNDPSFEGECLRLAGTGESVDTMEGCIMRPRSAGSIAREIRDGKIE